MTIGESIQALRGHWGELHLDVGPSGAATIANQSSARRMYSGSHNGALRAYDAPSLEMALTVALHAEGLGVDKPAQPGSN